MKIDLLWLGNAQEAPAWPLGKVLRCGDDAASVAAAMTEAVTEAVKEAVKEPVAAADGATTAEWLMVWDSKLGRPREEEFLAAAKARGDVFHAGLRVGLQGLPGLMDFARPNWMLLCDPDPAIEATSWRLSLRCCLLRYSVLKTQGPPRKHYESLTAMGLELGHRLLIQGVFVRHRPALLPTMISASASMPLADEFRFVTERFGQFWAGWAMLRAIAAGYRSPLALLAAWQKGRQVPEAPAPGEAPHASDVSGTEPLRGKVSVLIPTIERYPYLKPLLEQLRAQTIAPHEILVIDQTPIEVREQNLEAEFADLPLRVFQRDVPGQCSSRNQGLHAATGDFILFVDDDDEIQPDLIESHLRNLAYYQCDVSSGGVVEAKIKSTGDHYRRVRLSDGFPTNNTMVRREALLRSGLFDLAYDRGERADGDLGTRVYLSGALMVYNPEISLFHHHAPRGGLRVHGARVTTYAASRDKLTVRQLPSPTEIYLARRYYTPRQVRETLWIRALATLRAHGSGGRQLLKLLVGLGQLPSTLRSMAKNYRVASEMLTRFPQIPVLEDSGPARAAQPAESSLSTAGKTGND